MQDWTAGLIYAFKKNKQMWPKASVSVGVKCVPACIALIHLLELQEQSKSSQT